MKWLAHWPSLLFAMSWTTLILEGTYFLFIWPRTTRALWLVGMTSLHAGIAVFLGLHLFGLIMAILSIVIFGISAEPRPTTVAATAAAMPAATANRYNGRGSTGNV
jgi:hypothetical protein